MFNRFQHRGWHHAILLTAGAVLFLVNLGNASLWDVDEGRNMTCALEMLDSGNYIEPRLNSELRADKPVLLYWLQVLAYKTLGVNETAGRLPSALAALMTLLVCYELGRSMFGRMIGLLAGLIVASMPLMIASARFANPDALLHLFMVLAMFCLWQSERGGVWWNAGMGVSCGLAVLAKGPVGLVLPLASAVCYSLWIRNGRLFAVRRLVLASLTFVMTALPWYVLVSIETQGRFLREFLINHNVDRFLETANLHSASVWFYPAVLILGTIPWAIFAAPAFLYALAPLAVSRSEKRETASNCAGRFLVSWVVVIVLFFSLAATKLPSYILPVLIPCALLTSRYLVRWCRGEIRPPAWYAHVSLACLVIIGASVLAGTTMAGGVWHVPGLTSEVFPGLQRAAPLAAIPLAGSAICWWLLRRGNQVGLVWTVTLVSLGFMAPTAICANGLLNDFKAPRFLVEKSDMRHTDRDIFIAGWDVRHLPSLNFYSRRDIVHCDTPEQLLAYLNWDTARWHIDVYLVLPARDWEALKPKVTVPYRECAHHFDMCHHVDIVVISRS